MEIRCYKNAVCKAFLDSSNESQFVDRVFGVIATMIFDVNTTADDLASIYDLRDTLRTHFTED